MKLPPPALAALLLFWIAPFGWSEVETEPIPGNGVWIDSRMDRLPDEKPVRVTVWFEEQFLGDGEGFLRRAREFDALGRSELREKVIAALKSASDSAQEQASPVLKPMLGAGIISDLEYHWIVNGFSCTTTSKGLEKLKDVPGVRTIFLSGPVRDTLPEPSFETLPPQKKQTSPFDPETRDPLWYVKKLKVDRVWKELGVTGKGVLNVIHDGNFVISDWISESIYWNPDEPRDGEDSDGNGWIDDVNGFNFIAQTGNMTRQPMVEGRGNPSILHGHQCVAIICGRGGPGREVQPGLAPDSQWAGVIAMQNIEAAVEWAIEQGADTYSMSFSRPNLGEYRSHWRKIAEHGAFCGVHFVSGAGNFAQSESIPVQMRIPEDIPLAVLAAAGVQRDLTRTPFSSQGPVEWMTHHYRDGRVDKPEVCAFNARIPLLLPNEEKPTRVANGNSFAGPMYCGTIALMLSANPELKPWETRQIIIDTATDIAEEGFDFQTGHGLINAFEAVRLALESKKK